MHLIPDWLRSLLTAPSAELNRWEKALRFFLDLCAHGARQLRRDRAQQMAAALAYRTLFSLVPLLVVSVIVLSWVFGPQAFHTPLTRMLSYLGLDNLTLVTSAGDTLSALDAVVALVDRAEKVHLGTIGIIGLGILVYAALSLLVQVESSFNVVYASLTGRSWARRISQYWTLITLGPLLLVASFNVQARVQGLIADMSAGAVFVGAAGFVLTVSISWLLLLLAYISLPNARVHLRPALAGSFVAALLWELGKYAFTTYAGNLTGYGQLYGSLALLPIFMLWVYITWLIVLFGLELSYALQTIGGHRERLAQSEKPAAPAMIDPTAILNVARVVVDRFDKGAAASAEEIAEETSLPSPVVRAMLSQMVEKHVLHRLNGVGTGGVYTLARPADKVAATEVLACGFRLSEQQQEQGAVSLDFVAGLRELQINAVQGKSLAELVQIQHGQVTTDVPEFTSKLE